MSVVRIDDVGSNTIKQAEKLLAGINGGVNTALRSAMARTTSHLRTNSSKAIRERYAISHADIRTEQNVDIKYSYQNGVQANVLFSGRKIPLYRYSGTYPKMPTRDTSKEVAIKASNGTWITTSPSIPSAGHQLKSTSPVQFDNAFTAKMLSGHIGIFERTGGASSRGGDAIREIMGSSVPQMLGNKDVTEKLAKESMELFDKRLEHEVVRILNGWGG